MDNSLQPKQMEFAAAAMELALSLGFVPNDLQPEVRDYYVKDSPRIAIIKGMHDGLPSLFVRWNDERPRRAVAAHKYCQDMLTKSSILAIPKLRQGVDFDDKSGWAIIEPLPQGAQKIERAGTTEAISQWVGWAVEIARCFYQNAAFPRSLVKPESAQAAIMMRLTFWITKLGTGEGIRMAAGQEKLFPGGLDDILYSQACEQIHRVFGPGGLASNTTFGHGHLLPGHLYQVPGEERVWLSPFDLGHMDWKLPGWDWSMMAWANVLMNRNNSVLMMLADLDIWMRAARPHCRAFGLTEKSMMEVMRAAILERCLGTLIADLGATGDSSPETIQHRDRVMSVLKNYLLCLQ